jgi:sarcosine oxidase subunit gamma
MWKESVSVPDSYLRQSALAHLALEGRAVASRGEAGIGMKEVAFKGLVNLRGKPGDKAFLEAAKKTLGLPLLLEPNTTASKDDVTLVWLSPEEWLVITPGDGPSMANRLAGGLSGLHVSIVDVSESRTCIHLSGPDARKVLAKAGPLDVHPRSFQVGACAQTHLAKALTLIHHVSESEEAGAAYDIYLLRSFSDYLWRWLEDAAQEYGVVVLA